MSYPIDDGIMLIKNTIATNFTKKWFNHQHAQQTINCSQTITIDGNWKISRPKCCNDNGIYRSPEFGDVRLGCIYTPARGSYNCQQHVDCKLIFDINGRTKEFLPMMIKTTRLSTFDSLNLIFIKNLYQK